MKCIVKISISNNTNYFHIEEVIYYRANLSADFVTRWLWFFEYLAAKVKVANPRRNVIFYKGPQNVMLGQEWHKYRRAALIKSHTSKLRKLEKGIVEEDLFGFNKEDSERKKQEIKSQLDMLEKDIFPIADFPIYINKIKQFL